MTLALLGSVASAQVEPGPRYLPAVRQELERLDLEPDCRPLGRPRAECVLRVDDREVRVVISEVSETVTVAVLDLAQWDPNAADLGAKLRLLHELAWELPGAKLEWDPRTGAVRLSAVLHTDTNFDRRAFRVVVRELAATARRVAPRL